MKQVREVIVSQTLKIGQLAKLSGTTTKTIRYYELLGLLHEPERTDVGAFVLSMGLVHITGQTHRIPFLGRIAVFAMRAEGGGGPSLRSVYAYGAGYVVVGIGCVAPFRAAVSAFALVTGGFLTAFLTFLLFAATMGASC